MNHVLISNRNFVLRKVLNTEENIDIIKDIIEAFLNIKIKSIFLNTYLDEKYLPIEEKFGVTDVRIITDKNEEFNILNSIGVTFTTCPYTFTSFVDIFNSRPPLLNTSLLFIPGLL